MASVAILKRPKTAVQCNSCKQIFNHTDALSAHLQTATRAICSKTRAPTLLSCVDCVRPFSDLNGLVQHFEHTFAHNEELSKPTGRSVYVGRLPYGTTEKTLKEVLFAGYVIETTSMLTHMEMTGKFTDFAFVNLTTVEEANRAIKELHRSQFYGSRILVQAQRSNGGSGATSNGLQRQRVIAKCSATKEDMTPQKSGKQQAPKAVANEDSWIGLRGGAPMFHPSDETQPSQLPSHADEFYPAPRPVHPAVIADVGAPFINGYATVQYIDQPYRYPPPLTPAFQPTPDQRGWPSLVSSGPQPEARNWTIISPDQHQFVAETLATHCHNEAVLSSAGFNPIQPPKSELGAKVKCKHCRMARRNMDAKSECPTAPNKKHSFPGISHLTAKYKGFQYTPSTYTPKRFAITLDCEMAGGWNGDGFLDELIQLTAIDYLTGEVLISALVQPTTQIRQWRTSIHGISRQMIQQAVHDGTALKGYKAARTALFEHMDRNTILVGHALQNDLNVLKIAHTRCVDSEILASTAVNLPGNKQVSLKKLCEALMGLGVQRGKNHVCLEDSFAARELVMCMTLHPEMLHAWASVQRKKLEDQEAERQAKRKDKEVAEIAAAMRAESGTAVTDVTIEAPELSMDMPAPIPTTMPVVTDTRNASRPKRRTRGRGKKFVPLNLA